MRSKQQHVCKVMNQYMINTNRKWILSQGIDFGFLKENIRAIQEKVWCSYPLPYIFKAFSDEHLSFIIHVVKVIYFMSILLFLDKISLVQIKHKTTAADI
jgi:hypothetical protein